MAIRKKPMTSDQEAKIYAVIQKWGSPTHHIVQNNEPYRLTLRIPAALKNRVDEWISLDPTEPSLTAWILEAMKQRLQREKQNEIT